MLWQVLGKCVRNIKSLNETSVSYLFKLSRDCCCSYSSMPFVTSETHGVCGFIKWREGGLFRATVKDKFCPEKEMGYKTHFMFCCRTDSAVIIGSEIDYSTARAPHFLGCLTSRGSEWAPRPPDPCLQWVSQDSLMWRHYGLWWLWGD